MWRLGGMRNLGYRVLVVVHYERSRISLDSQEEGNVRTGRKALSRAAYSTSNPNHSPLLYLQRAPLTWSALEYSNPNSLFSASPSRTRDRLYSRHVTSAAAMDRSSSMSLFPTRPCTRHRPGRSPCRRRALRRREQSAAYPTPSLWYSSHRPTGRGSVRGRGCMFALPIRGCVMAETCEGGEVE